MVPISPKRKAQLRYARVRLHLAWRRHDKTAAKKWTARINELEKVVKKEARLRPMRLKAYDVLAALVDRVNEKGGNNRGPEVNKIIRANGGTPGEPWCGDTQAFAYLKAGSKSVQRAWASVNALERLLTKVRFPMRGHIVIYDFNHDGDREHTGMFDKWVNKKAGTFYALEGNTGTDGARSDGTGDGIHRRLRNVSQVSSFRRVIR